jgi:hypothetical protein
VQALRTPSNQTGSDLLAELNAYTTVLPDSTLSPKTMSDLNTGAAVVNTSLLSHILANTSAFYEYSVCFVLFLPPFAICVPGAEQLQGADGPVGICASLQR